MREIKFRAWDRKAKWMFPIQNMEWDKITGELLRFTGVDVKHPESDSEGNMFFGGSPSKKFGTSLVKRYELMQFTGLRDKNGKDIYEGDRVKVTFPERKTLFLDVPESVWDASVSFDYGVFYWTVQNGPIGTLHDLTVFGVKNPVGEIEVIGNIYESEVQG